MRKVMLLLLTVIGSLLTGCAGYLHIQTSWESPSGSRTVRRIITRHQAHIIYYPVISYQLPKVEVRKRNDRYEGFYGLPLDAPFVVLTNGLHGRGHNAVDIRASVGTRVVAAASGQIIKAAWDARSGNYITIYHSRRNSETSYCHLSQICVRCGEYVSKGQVIGLSGDTGWDCRGAHLHFAVSGDENPFGHEELYYPIYPSYAIASR